MRAFFARRGFPPIFCAGNFRLLRGLTRRNFLCFLGVMFKEISPLQVSENAVKLIGSDWALVAAGSAEKFNMMTVSWGGLGVMWGKPAVWIFIRPQRYTLEFIEKSEYFTLSFFGEAHRGALKLCGSKSGRDCDKAELANLTTNFLEGSGAPYFEEANIVFECRKMYAQNLKGECFLDASQLEKWYPQNDLHKMFVAEISKVLGKF